MGRLAQWDSKVLGLNSTDGIVSGSQPYFEAPGSLHIVDVIVSCPKLAMGQLVQI